MKGRRRGRNETEGRTVGDVKGKKVELYDGEMKGKRTYKNVRPYLV